MRSRALAAAVLLFGSAAARAQLTCTPNRLLAGAEIRNGSPGALGGSPSGDVVFTYKRTTGGPSVGSGAPRSWSAREVACLLPAGPAAGVYEAVGASPAGALRNPSCFTIGPPLVAITTIRVRSRGWPATARNADAALNRAATRPSRRSRSPASVSRGSRRTAPSGPRA